MFRSVVQSLRPTRHMPFCVFQDFYASGRQDAEVTKSLRACYFIILLNWQVESQLAVAEEITFPYVWGTYDLLILPPSFPYGGMENPCLTFVTPTLLVGEGVSCLSINILLYCLELLVCCTVCH